MKTISELLRPADYPNWKRICACIAIIIVLYSATIGYLIAYWYQLEGLHTFHWFDDSDGWLQMDKWAHSFGAYAKCGIAVRFFLWTGIGEKRAYWLAVIGSFISQSTYEIFDGLSPAYGASVADLAANATGSLLLLVQWQWWGKRKIFNKISFFPTAYAALRPQFFGDSLPQQFLKDYNGLTFWYTLDVNALINKKILPRWLCLTIGFSADGLVGGDDNIWTDKDGTTHDYSHIVRARKFIFSVDFNWPMLKESRWHVLAHFFTYVKFPAPALEFHTATGLRFHWCYF